MNPHLILSAAPAYSYAKHMTRIIENIALIHFQKKYAKHDDGACMSPMILHGVEFH